MREIANRIEGRTSSRFPIAMMLTKIVKKIVGFAILHRVIPAAKSAVSSLCRSSQDKANMPLASERIGLVASKNEMSR